MVQGRRRAAPGAVEGARRGAAGLGQKEASGGLARVPADRTRTAARASGVQLPCPGPPGRPPIGCGRDRPQADRPATSPEIGGAAASLGRPARPRAPGRRPGAPRTCRPRCGEPAAAGRRAQRRVGAWGAAASKAPARPRPQGGILAQGRAKGIIGSAQRRHRMTIRPMHEPRTAAGAAGTESARGIARGPRGGRGACKGS